MFTGSGLLTRFIYTLMLPRFITLLRECDHRRILPSAVITYVDAGIFDLRGTVSKSGTVLRYCGSDDGQIC